MEIRNVEEKATLAIRTTIAVEKISEVMAAAYGEIATYMGSKGLEFAGSPYALYRNMDMSALDLEMGFPIASAVEGEGRIQAGIIPGGSIATVLHTGAYSDIGSAYEKLKAFVEEQTRSSEEWCYEFYLNSPEDTAPADLKTEICFPLK